MPFNQNTSQNTVVYTSGQWDSRDVKANDQSVTSSTDYVSAFKVAVGKYERILWKADLHWDYGAGDLKYKILVPAGLAAKGFKLFEEESELPVSGDVVMTNRYYANTTGAAERSYTVDAGAAYLRLQGTLVNGATAGNLDIQFTQRASNSEASSLTAGSYFEYMRF